MNIYTFTNVHLHTLQCGNEHFCSVFPDTAEVDWTFLVIRSDIIVSEAKLFVCQSIFWRFKGKFKGICILLIYLFWWKLKQLVFLPLPFVSFWVFKNHLGRKRSKPHGPLMSSLESHTDTRVAELGLPSNTDQTPEFQEWTAPPIFTAEPQEVLVFQRDRDPPPSRQPVPENHSCCSASAVKTRPSGALMWDKRAHWGLEGT